MNKSTQRGTASPQNSEGAGGVLTFKAVKYQTADEALRAFTRINRTARKSAPAVQSDFPFRHADGRPRWTVVRGDCIDAMAAMPANSVDVVGTDPPYGAEFMGAAWDTFTERGSQTEHWDAGQDNPFARNATPRYGGKKLGNKLAENLAFLQFSVRWLSEAYRVLKPGGYLFAFGFSRTYGYLQVAVEMAGFELRDTIVMAHGTGMPKSSNIGHKLGHDSKTALGSALKPACEFIVVARKPFKGSLISNMQEHGVGALHIDDCRIEGAKPACKNSPLKSWRRLEGRDDLQAPEQTYDPSEGRWPTHLILSESAAAALDEQSGQLSAGNRPARRNVSSTFNANSARKGAARPGRTDAGGASRFFKVVPDEEPDAFLAEELGIVWTTKPGIKERDAGLDDFLAQPFVQYQTGNGASGNRSSWCAGRDTRRKNNHPCLKSIELLRYLCRLVVPEGGIILDPFMGSGSTGCAVGAENRDPERGRGRGWSFIGIEREHEYAAVAAARLRHWWDEDGEFVEAPPETKPDDAQLALDLFPEAADDIVERAA